MSYSYDDKSIEEAIDKNNLYTKVAYYITENKSFPNLFFSLEDAKKFAKYLIEDELLIVDDILSGMNDNEIYSLLIRIGSLKKKDDKDIPLRTKKEFISKDKLIAIILTLTTIGASFAYKDNKEKEINDIISSKVSVINAEGKKVSILKNNEYVVPHTLDENGERVIAYDSRGISNDIINKCSNNPELLELCLYNIYFDMNYERLSNMDDVIKWLKYTTETNDELMSIYNEIKDCSVFLDYLVKKGYSNNDDNILDAVNKYKLNGNFNNLDELSQGRIKELINNFENSKQKINERSIEDIIHNIDEGRKS